jgi:hypothetical protein
MAFRPAHEIYRRRLGRNLGVGLTLVAFVAIIFGLTVAKVRAVGPIEGYDHVVQPHLVPAEATQ